MLSHLPGEPPCPRQLNAVANNPSTTALSEGDADVAVPVVPVPADAPEATFEHWKFGRPTQCWTYTDIAGAVHHYRVRFDPSDQRKQVVPCSLWRVSDGTLKWQFKAVPGLQPLYRLADLAADPSLDVIIVEGEKCADAAQEVFPSAVVVTSPGGAASAAKADWSVLAGRHVLIWPDLDEAGQAYAEKVALVLQGSAQDIQIVDAVALASTDREGCPREPKKGWDVVDALDEGWSPSELCDRVLSLTSAWAPLPSPADPLPGLQDASEVTSDPAFLAALQELAQLKAGDYALKRKEAAKQWQVKVGVLDGLVRRLKGEPEIEHHPAQRDMLLELVTAAKAELWRDTAGTAYATILEADVRKTFKVRSGDFRSWLIRRWIDHFADGEGLTSIPGGQALNDALGAVEARAMQGAVHPIFVRIGHADDRVFIDLGDDTWEAVAIDEGGWRVVQEPPVRFIRPPGLLPLPRPTSAPHGLEALYTLLPDGTDAKDAKVLLVSFLLAVFLPRGSFPILALSGGQGSGKTTLTRRIRALTDPNQAPARQRPRSEDDLIIASANGAILAFDNLTHIDGDLSDALCRLATGAGFSKRRLYSDSDEIIVEVRRPVIINGISDLVRMPDLADRALFVDLPKRTGYTPEVELEATFEENWPAILGTLYTAISAALKGYKGETASPGVRLVDFERWVRAAVQALGLEADEVSRVLVANRGHGDRMLVDDDVVACNLMKLLDADRRFRGTASQLLKELRLLADEGEKILLPKGPRALSVALKRLQPPLERSGVTMERKKEDGRLWLIQKREPTSVEVF